MPILLQLAQSYSNPESVNYKLAYLREQMEQQLLNLGDLAYADKVQLAMLGDTIQIGGYLRTELIAANSIVGDKIAANSIVGDKIASNAIVARHIQANAITSDKIAAQSITADKIAAQSITADKIASNAIATQHIQAGAITADKIATNAITADKINVASLSAISANLGTMRSFPSRKTFGPFTEADRDRVQAILLQTITPTPDDYEKYDINRNGVIDITDLLKIQKRVIEGGTVTVNYEVIINSDDPSSLIEAVATYTPDGTVERTKIGTGGIVSSTVITDRLIPSGGFTGSFTTGDGKIVHVNNGIITAVL